MATAANAAASAPLRSLLSRLTIKGPDRGPEAVLSAACSELRACAASGASGATGGASSAASPSSCSTPNQQQPSPLREALDEIRALRLQGSGAAGGKEDVALAHAVERRRAILRGEFFFCGGAKESLPEVSFFPPTTEAPLCSISRARSRSQFFARGRAS
jgi:hypothetical protein